MEGVRGPMMTAAFLFSVPMLCAFQLNTFRAMAPRTAAARVAAPAVGPGMTLKLDPEAASDLLGSTDVENAADTNGPFGKGGALEWVAIASDAVATVALGALHTFDDKAVQDSSKNLQVLWVRALLENSGEIDDHVAYELLPKSTRGVFGPENAGAWSWLLPWTEWIAARTKWIDNATDIFLSSPACAAGEAQIVVFGAGFDTRSLRYQRAGLSFFEVDLPDTIVAKRVVHNRYADEHPGVRLPELVGMDLNDCAEASMLDKLSQHGFKPDVPTLFIWEAVLFYVKPVAIGNLLAEVFAHGAKTESMYCFTDSMRPFVQGPFLDESDAYFSSHGLELLAHESRWGGAVQFAHAVSTAQRVAEPSLRDHAAARLEKPLNTYAPAVSHTTQSENPSFTDTWYAIGTSEQVSQDSIFATRLWGEPIVLYRDADSELVCLRDVCPHRSAPLSMGEIKDGVLRCIYHGWAFGSGGRCIDVPTNRGSKSGSLDANCAVSYSVIEHEGLMWVWRGNPLSADLRKLPRHPAPETTHVVDTLLDYGCDWSYIVENNLDSPHLYWLHDGSIPPLETLGFVRSNVSRIALRAFKDDIGIGHIGKTGGKGLTKVIRYDAPNVVRHCGVSGFSEEFHIIPVAPHRTRVILRQRFPKGPLLSTLLQVPGATGLLRFLVNNWNYHISLEDYSVMQGQAHNVDDLGAPHWDRAGLGDDLIIRFWEWMRRAEETEGQPYFTRWDGTTVEPKYGPQTADDQVRGTYGLRKTYVQDTPVAEFAPINYAPYKQFLENCEVATKAGVAGLASVPTAFAAWKTVGPAVAEMIGGDLSSLH